MLPYPRPHHLNPRRNSLRVIWFYYNFGAIRGLSHIGLGVSTNHTTKTLARKGVWTELVPVTSARAIGEKLSAMQDDAARRGQVPVSHVILSAPWVPTDQIGDLCTAHPDVKFVVLSHSNVAFVAADRNGFARLHELSQLANTAGNFFLAGNCKRFSDWATRALLCRCLFLPNLYDLETFRPLRRRPWQGHLLRIGCYGAPRIQKNIISGAGAALDIAERLNVDVELHVNSGRDEHAGVLGPVRQLVNLHRRATLVEDHWSTWGDFRNRIGTMDLLLQPSWTESFNMVTADGVAEGLATATYDAVDWVPSRWIARLDDTVDLATVGINLLFDPHAAENGQDALREYVETGVRQWKNFLLSR